MRLARLSILSCCLSAATLAADGLPSRAHDLEYGNALYALFQKDYSAALTRLAVKESRGGVLGHGDRPSLLYGAICLVYGLEQEAHTRFVNYRKKHDDDNISERAWLSLARLLYQRGKVPEAEAVLEGLDNPDPESELGQEFLYLRGALASRQGRVAEMPEGGADSLWSVYALFNHALATSAAGNADAGFELMQRARDIVEAFDTEEAHLLQDKMGISMGLVAVKAEQFERAVAAFQTVRTDGLFNDAALMGYGLALRESGHAAAALTVWERLLGSEPDSFIFTEAYLYSAETYELSGEIDSAMQMHKHYSRILATELDRLQGQASRLQSDEYLEQLLAFATTDELENSSESASDDDAGARIDWIFYPGDLRALLARKSVSATVKQLLDARQIRHELDERSREIGGLRLALEQKKAVRMTRKHALQDPGNPRRPQALNRRQQQLQQDYQAALSRLQQSVPETHGYEALNAEQQVLLQRLQTADARLQRLAQLPGLDAKDYRARLDKLQGRLQWEANENWPVARWRWQRELRSSAELLDDNIQRRSRLDALLAQEQPLQTIEQRLDEMDRSLQFKRQHARELEDRSRTELRQHLQAEFLALQSLARGFQQAALRNIARLSDKQLGLLQ